VIGNQKPTPVSQHTWAQDTHTDVYPTIVRSLLATPVPLTTSAQWSEPLPAFADNWTTIQAAFPPGSSEALPDPASLITPATMTDREALQAILRGQASTAARTLDDRTMTQPDCGPRANRPAPGTYSSLNMTSERNHESAAADYHGQASTKGGNDPGEKQPADCVTLSYPAPVHDSQPFTVPFARLEAKSAAQVDMKKRIERPAEGSAASVQRQGQIKREAEPRTNTRTPVPREDEQLPALSSSVPAPLAEQSKWATEQTMTEPTPMSAIGSTPLPRALDMPDPPIPATGAYEAITNKVSEVHRSRTVEKFPPLPTVPPRRLEQLERTVRQLESRLASESVRSQGIARPQPPPLTRPLVVINPPATSAPARRAYWARTQLGRFYLRTRR
jgi:hypothetical protein